MCIMDSSDIGKSADYCQQGGYEIALFDVASFTL
jgi:hypothetical protein